MLEMILKDPVFILYLLGAEGILLCFLQLRTNALLRKNARARVQKKEAVKRLKEEVKKGESKIPVVKFEKPKAKPEMVKKQEQKQQMDTNEMAVLQEMMSEFFS